MNILIIEDDERVSDFIKVNLQKQNYSVATLNSYQDLENFLVERPFVPKLFILDRLLGNDDSKNLLKKIKKEFSGSMVLFLSALNSPSEKAALLDEGADDYLGKPFSLVELEARVRAILRRHGGGQQPSQGLYLEIGDLIIDLKARSVICQGLRPEFTPKEFSLLVNFCENRNKVFSKYQLLDLIWEANLDIESNVIEVNIMNIRKKLEQCGSKIKILSKRNVGYWLEA